MMTERSQKQNLVPNKTYTLMRARNEEPYPRQINTTLKMCNDLRKTIINKL